MRWAMIEKRHWKNGKGYCFLLLNAGGEIRELPVKVNKIKTPNLKCDKNTTEI